MNAAARALTEGVVIASASGSIRKLSLSRPFIIISFLVIALILSALGMITIADNNRIAFGDLASLQQSRDALHTTYGQLLLEANTWSAPARVQKIATERFGMVEANTSKVIIIKS